MREEEGGGRVGEDNVTLPPPQAPSRVQDGRHGARLVRGAVHAAFLADSQADVC